ncbi:acyltransferase [Rubripirellula sp.]|nr:acyltransferase [Rubripirellula sp.]
MKYFTLDLFRGLAALWVFAYHFDFSSHFRDLFPTLTKLFSIGHLGVPIFFVISGYCITTSARRSIAREANTLSFIYRRLRRIYPPMWCSAILFVVGPWLVQWILAVKTGEYQSPPNHRLEFLQFGFWDWVRITSLSEIFVGQAPGSPNVKLKFVEFNPPYWSLAIEVQFYLVVAICLALPRKFFLKSMTVVTVLSFVSLLLGLPESYGFFVNHWPGFAFGAILAILIEKGYDPAKAHSLFSQVAFSVVGLSCFYIAIINGMTNGGSSKAFAFLFAFGLWAIRPIDLAIEQKTESKTWNGIIKTLAFPGIISYSIYLLHFKLSIVIREFAMMLLPWHPIAIDITVVLTTCLLCVPFYFLCEKPFASHAPKEDQRKQAAT